MFKSFFIVFFILVFSFFGKAQFISCNDISCGTLEPSWRIIGSESRVCEGESFLLSADESTPLDNIESFRWIIYKGNFEILFDTTFNDTTPLEYLFEVDDEDFETCTDSVINFQVNLIVTSPECPEGQSCRNSLEPLTVVLKPRADFGAPVICQNEEIIFQDSSCFATSYLWDFGNGQTSTEVNPPFTYNDEGIYNVSLTVYNECGQNTKVKQVEVIGLPEAEAVYTLDPDTGCTDLDVLFDNQIDDYTNYSSAMWTISPLTGWYFSDTIYDETSWDNGITFFDPGIFGIQLTVSNICGMAIWTDSIEVFEAPSATLVPPGNQCIEIPGQSVTIDFSQFFTLTGSSCGFDWEITNTTTSEIFNSTEQFPVFTFDDAGDYEVELTIDGCNCGDESESTEFTIQIPADLTFDVPNNNPCTNSDPFQIIPSVSGGIWSPQPLISPDGIFNPALAVIGNNEVNYSVGTGACLSEASVIIEVSEAPSLMINVVPGTCDSIQYVPSIVYTGNYSTESWNLIHEDGSVEVFDPDVIASIPISSPGIYEFAAQLTGDCNPVSDTIVIEIIASISDIDAGSNDSLCIIQSSYSLSGTPPGGIWQEIGGSNGTGLTDSTGVIDLVLAGEGTHQYEYSYGTGTDCEISDIVSIEIIDFSDVNAGPDLFICEDISAFSLNGTPATQGLWNGPGVTSSGYFDPALLTPGNYTLSYCLSDPSINCSACDEMEITISILPVADFQILGTNCVEETLDIENLSINACSYFWDFGNGQTSTDSIPAPIYNNIGSYDITLVAESCASCFDTLIFPIEVTEPASPGFVQSITQGCATLEVDFVNQSTGTELSYSWDFGNGQTSTIESPGTISFEQGNYDTTYYVVLAVTNGCGTIEYHDSVTVFPLPIVVFGTNIDDGCSPLEIEFSNISLGNPQSYEWYIDGVLVSTDSAFQNQIFTTSDTATTNYTITLIANNLCGSDTLNNEVIVYPPNVDAFFHVDTTSGCQPLTVNFSNFSTPGAQISWDFGDGNGSFETSPTHTFDSAGIFTVYQYASNCGTDTDSIIIEVLPAPFVNFIHEPFVCEGQAISFINTSTGLDGSEWHFGDGDTSFLDSPIHIFNEPGTYIITLTGYSSINNCPATFQSEVIVLGNPNISFVPSTYNGCAPLSIDFTNTSTDAVFYEWDFGNGEVSTEESPQDQLFVNPDTYEVSLIGTDSFGCYSDTSVINIIVHPVPQGSFFTNDNEYCSGVDLIETTNTSQGANQYYWAFGDGPVIETFEPTQIIQDTGELVITMIAENGFTCRDTTISNVQILATPIAFSPTQEFVGCSPLGVQFGNASEYADVFLWGFGENNNTSIDEEPFYTYNTAGSYNATMIAMNTNGCPSDTIDFDITVHPKPISDFELSDLLTCGLPDTIQTTNFSQGADDYLWGFGNGMNSTLNAPSIIYQNPGDYTISLIVSNVFNCMDTMEQMVSVNLQPIASFEPGQYIECEPAIVNFSNTSINADSWYWDFGDGDSSEETVPSHEYPEAGVYSVQLIATYNESCFDSIIISNAITILESPIAAFTYIDSTDGQIQFINQSMNAAYYEWDFGNGDFSEEIAPYYVYDYNGNWQVILTATHLNGCQGMDTLSVMPDTFFGLYLPNAMSPESAEGDARLFKPAGIGIADCTVQVYAPWGQLLWENSELDGEQPKGSWDGSFKGQIVPQGAYAWKAEVEFINGIRQVKTGTVTVLR